MAFPSEILTVWQRFDDFCMETVSKMHLCIKEGTGRQRTVQEMIDDRNRYGLSGNCIDLTYWLLEECRADAIDAYPVSAGSSHTAVIMRAFNGNRYLADLGDMWLFPVPLEDPFLKHWQKGWFPAADVRLTHNRKKLTVHYRRPGGKEMHQTYDLRALSENELASAADASQQSFRKAPLIEKRITYLGRPAHWEYDNWMVKKSTETGLLEESSAPLNRQVEQISRVTGMDERVLFYVLDEYAKIKE